MYRSLRNRPSRRKNLAREIAALLAATGTIAHSADLYWDGTTAGWNAVANWSTVAGATTPDPSTVPGASDLAIFNVTTANGAETISLNAAQAALGLVFNNTGTTALQGGGTNQTLTLGASGIAVNAGAGAVTIGSTTAGQNVALTLSAAQSWVNNSSSALTVSNTVNNGGFLLTVNGSGNTAVTDIVSGAGGLTKTGAGTLTLSAANSFTGTTTVSQGILRAQSNAGALGAGALALSGGTLQLANDAALAFNRNTTVTANSTITSDRLAAGAGVAHTLGTLSIGGQTLSVTRGANATSGTGQITFGATTMTGAAIWDVQANALLQLGAVGETGGSRAITKVGAGILTLSGASTYSGSTDVQLGTLRVTNAGALGNSMAVNLTAVSGSTNFELQGNITMGLGKTVTLNTNTTGDLRSNFLNGSGNNTWQGNVVLSGTGFAQINAASGTTMTIAGNVTSTGGGTTGSFAARGSGTVIFTGNLNLGSDRNFSHTDTGTVIVASTGNTWKFTQVSDGQVQLGVNDALATAADLQFGQNSGTSGRFELNGFNQTVAGFRTTSGSTGTNHIVRNSNISSASTLTVTPTGTDTLTNTHLQGSLQNLGSLTLVKNGTGRLNLQDIRMDNAAITVNDGTLGLTGTATLQARANFSGLAAGTIEKSGTGAVNFHGTYSHLGTTNLLGGRLNIGAGNSGTLSTATGTTLGVGFKGGVLNVNALTLGSTGASTFAPQLATPAGSAPINAGSLAVNGTVTVTPFGVSAVGTYPLIGYTGTIGGTGLGGFTLGAVGTYPHITAAIVDNPGVGVNLNVTATDSLVWVGGTAAWDINTTANFKLASDGTPATFFQGDAVLFDDTATTKAITVTGTPTIGNLTFNNSTGNDYTITGALTGPGGITKNNTGTVTLATASNYTGATKVTNGVLVLGAANAVVGDVQVTGGTLRFGNADALAQASSITVLPGGTIDVNGTTPVTKVPNLHVSGAGVGGLGAIYNGGAGVVNATHFSMITLDGDTTWGGPGRYDVNAIVVNGGTYTLTKKGAGELAYQPAAGSTLGNVIVDGGIFTSQTSNPLAASSTVIVNNGAIHNIYSAVTVQHQVTLNDGGTVRAGNSTPTLAGQVNLSGTTTNRFIGAITGTTLNVAGKITGTGGFTKADVGTVTIKNAANDYAGDTAIAAGTLNFDTVGSLPTTTNLVFSGGTLDPANRAHTFASIAGASGSINQGTAGTGVVISNQSTSTTFSGTVNRVTVQMNGTGTLTLAGTSDNAAGIGIANSGVLVLAKSGDLAAHAVGSGLTINNGGTVQLGGTPTATNGSGVNTAPTGAPANYVDQIYNNVNVALNAGGTLDLGGRSESVQAITGTGLVTNSTPATNSVLYFGSAAGTNVSSTFGGTIENGAGTVGIEKLGATTLTLPGAHTYTGMTTVTAGTLNVTGSLGNTAVNVANGATLTGPGAIGGSVTLTGAFTGSGNIAGTLTANQNSTVSLGGATNGASVATISTAGVVFGAGATRSLLLDFNGTAADRINTTTVNGLMLDGTTNVTVQPGAAGWVTGSFPIFTYNPAGTLQGAGASSLVLQNPTGHSVVTFADNLAGNINMNVTATTTVWKGNVSNVWDHNGVLNWVSSDSKFLNGDNVLFDDTASNFAPTIATAVTTGAVTFDNTANAYTLSGAAGISGAGNLVKKGTNTVTFTNPNTYTGTTFVQAGTLVANFNNGTATTVLNAASVVDVTAGATFKAVANDSDFTFGNNVTGAGMFTIDPHATADAGSRQVTMNGSLAGFTGTLNLVPTTGTNGFRLSTDSVNDLGGANVNISGGGQVFVTAGSLTFPNNFTLSGSGYSEAAGRLGAIRAANPTTLTGTIAINGSAKIGALGGVVNVTNTLSGGTLTFGGSNNASNETMNFTGTTTGLTGLTVNEGVATGNAATILLNIGNGTATGHLGTTPVTIRGDGFKTGVLRFDRTDGYVLGGAIAGAGTLSRVNLDLDVQGAGFDSNGKSITPGTAASGGLLRVGVTRANAVATLTNSTVTTGSLQIGAGGGATGAILNVNSGTTISASQIDVGLGATNARMNIASGTTINLTGGFFLGQQSGFAGTVAQSGGDVSIGARFQIGHWPNNTSTYTIDDGSFTVATVGTATNPSGTAEQNGGIYLGVDGTGILTINGGSVLADWVVLDNRGDTGGNDQLNINGGNLSVRMSYGIIRRNGSAQVNFGGGTITNAGTGVSANIDAPLNITGTTAAINTNLATNSFNILQSVSGAGRLAKQGAGTLNFNAANSGWTGDFAVTGGTAATGVSGGFGSFTTAGRAISASNASILSLATNNVFGDGVGNANTPSITLNGGATLTTTRYNAIGSLTLNGATLTSAHGTNDGAAYQAYQLLGNVSVGGTAASAISGTGSFPGVHLNASTVFQVGDATGNGASDLVVSVPLLDPSADFTGSGSLVKDGPGTMELAAGVASTFTGPTSVLEGNLLVHGSLTGSVISIDGGTLGGTGAVGQVNVVNGTLAPGASAGILSAQSVAFHSGSVFAVELGGVSPGTEYDQLNVGSLNLNSNLGVGSTLSLSLVGGYAPADLGTFFIAINDGNDAILGTFGNASGAGNIVNVGGQAFAVSYDADSVSGTFHGGNDIAVMAVPEPSSTITLLAGLGALLGGRRARRRK